LQQVWRPSSEHTVCVRVRERGESAQARLPLPLQAHAPLSQPLPRLNFLRWQHLPNRPFPSTNPIAAAAVSCGGSCCCCSASAVEYVWSVEAEEHSEGAGDAVAGLLQQIRHLLHETLHR
jgi:hypothetical protein